MRTLTAEQLRELRKKTTTRKVEYYRPDGSREQPFRYEFDHVDDDLFNAEFWDSQIVAWNFKDPEGNPIPCTRENKLLLLGNSNEFAAWVMRCITKLDQDEKKKIEDLEKN